MIESARTWLELRSLRRGSFAPPDAIAARRERLLADALAHARAKIPFYRRLWGGTPLELGRLPVVTGTQVREALASGELLAEDARPSASFESTGTTGAPIAVPRGVVEQRRWRTAALRAWFEHGYRWRHSTVHFEAHAGPAHPLQRLGVSRTAWISPELETGEMAERFVAARADAVAATPTVLRRLCGALDGQAPRPRVVFSQGEVLDRGTAGLVERVLGTAPVDVYGLTEAGYVGWQCERREHLHVNAEVCMVEVLVDGRRAAPGEVGSVVVTDLRGRTAPMIRYDTGDLAFAPEEPCACGRTLPLLGRVAGRAREALAAPGGRM